MRQRVILKRLALILLATIAIAVVNTGALAILLYSRRQLSFSNIASSLWFLLMLEGLFVALIGCFMTMPIGGITGGPSGGRGIPGRFYIPPERSKKSSRYAYDVIIVGILLFVLSFIVYSISL